MFTTLLESGAKVTGQNGWLTTSSGFHMIVLAGAVVLTPQRTVEIARPEPEVLIWVHKVPVPTRTSTSSSSGPGPTRRAPSLPEIRSGVGPIVDVVIPDIITGQASEETSPGDFESGSPFSSSSGTGSSPMSAGAVDKPALPLPGNTRPTYPEMLRSAGIEGSTLMRFVIDTMGRVEPQSLHVMHADQPLFAVSVRAALKQHRFLPAEAAGRKVRMLVEQRFDFALNSR